MTENIHYKTVADRAEASRKAAAEALIRAQGIPGGDFALVAALQAQAQIDILHVLSWDISRVEDAVAGSG